MIDFVNPSNFNSLWYIFLDEMDHALDLEMDSDPFCPSDYSGIVSSTMPFIVGIPQGSKIEATSFPLLY